MSHKARYIIAGMLLMATEVCAQNNIYKIDDRVYSMYARADRLRNDPASVVIADSAYQLAVMLGDKKGQCVTKTVPLRYYCMKKDAAKARECFEVLREMGRRHGFLQYTYHAYTQYVGAQLNMGNILAATSLIQDMEQDARRDKYAFGYFQCLVCQGDLYASRTINAVAIEKYKEALEYMRLNVEGQSPVSVLRKLGQTYHHESMFQDAIMTMQEALKYNMAEASVMSLKAEMASCYYKLGNMEMFVKLYNDVKDSSSISKEMRREIEFFHAMLEKDYDRARQYVDEQLPRQVHLNAEEHNYEAAFMNTFAMLQEVKRVNNIHVRNELMEFTERLRNEQLRAENAELKLTVKDERGRALEAERDRQALQLANTQLELQAKEDENLALEMERDNQALKLRNTEYTLQNAEMERQRTERAAALQRAERDKALLERDKKAYELRQQEMEQRVQLDEEKRQRNLILSVGVMLLMAMAWLIYALIQHRRSMRQIREALHKAETADRIKTAFIQNMSHEIRTPLNAVCGFAQLLVDPSMQQVLGDADREEFGRAIRANVGLTTKLVDDILDISDIDCGKYKIVLAEHDVHAVCREAMNEVRHQVPQDVEMRYETLLPEKYMIHTDAKRVQQVLNNLLGNACKFTEHGQVTLRTCLHEGRVRFVVTDSGPGIPEDKAEVIFERFEKLDSFRQGTGLGLSICRSIANMLHGRVFLDTTYHAGARFILDI